MKQVLSAPLRLCVNQIFSLPMSKSNATCQNYDNVIQFIMTTRAAKPVTVTLGPLTEMAQGRVASGRYASVS